MDADLQHHAREAIARLQHVLDRGPEVQHDEIQSAAKAVISFRNRAIEKCREGTVSDACLDRANALVSLAYGAEFPLSGLHFHRIAQTCEGMSQLLAAHASEPDVDPDGAGCRARSDANSH